MGLTGLLNSIITAVAAIDYDRKGFAIIGKEREGRISYEDGIAKAMSAFKEAQATADPETTIVYELCTMRSHTASAKIGSPILVYHPSTSNWEQKTVEP